MMRLLSAVLKPLIRVGTLDVIDHAGKRHRFAGTSGPRITLRLHDRHIATRLALDPEVAPGEGYMDGRVTIEDASL